MQYTLRNIPTHLDEALRARARQENKSLNQVAVEALERALGLAGEAVPQRDLADVAGTWQEDRATEDALNEQRRVDPQDWQ